MLELTLVIILVTFIVIVLGVNRPLQTQMHRLNKFTSYVRNGCYKQFLKCGQMGKETDTDASIICVC